MMCCVRHELVGKTERNDQEIASAVFFVRAIALAGRLGALIYTKTAYGQLEFSSRLNGIAIASRRAAGV